LIVTKNVPPNFERELAFDDEASFDTSNFFGQKSKLIVDSIPSYEGAQKATSKLIVIWAFGLNELIKLISASRHQQLIVAYVKTNSKIYLIFGEECRTFCEGEWEQQVGNISLAGYTSRISLIGHIGLVGLISFVGLGFFGVNGLVGVIGLIGINSLIGHNNLVDHIGLVGYIGLVRRINLVDYIGLFGHIGLVGRTLSFIGLGLVGYIGLSFIGLSGLSGISGLISQISLINLSASWNHGPIGIIGIVGFGHIIASSASAVS
jgi:hypothetical protein